MSLPQLLQPPLLISSKQTSIPDNNKLLQKSSSRVCVEIRWYVAMVTWLQPAACVLGVYTEIRWPITAHFRKSGGQSEGTSGNHSSDAATFMSSCEEGVRNMETKLSGEDLLQLQEATC